MAKQKEYVKISFNMPKQWITMIDGLADRQFTTRSQIIKQALIALCLRNYKGKTINR